MKIKIFIGYDPRETVAYHVLTQSIHDHATMPVSVTPLVLTQLNYIYSRPRHRLQSTDFSFTRFLVPYLSGYLGWSLYMDCDMLVLDDIVKLWEMRDDRYAVMVVKHPEMPSTGDKKFLNEPQTTYHRKYWSSLMLFNNAKCLPLTPELVNRATGLELHQFEWLEDKMIGALPREWNHLVDVEPRTENAACVHFTLGGPYFKEYQDCSYSEQWHQFYNRATAPVSQAVIVC